MILAFAGIIVGMAAVCAALLAMMHPPLSYVVAAFYFGHVTGMLFFFALEMACGFADRLLNLFHPFKNHD